MPHHPRLESLLIDMRDPEDADPAETIHDYIQWAKTLPIEDRIFYLEMALRNPHRR